MATRTITDRGSNFASTLIERNGAAASTRATLNIQTADGEVRTVVLGAAELAATLTAGERTALAATLDKLYARALVLEGFA